MKEKKLAMKMSRFQPGQRLRLWRLVLGILFSLPAYVFVYGDAFLTQNRTTLIQAKVAQVDALKGMDKFGYGHEFDYGYAGNVSNTLISRLNIKINEPTRWTDSDTNSICFAVMGAGLPHTAQKLLHHQSLKVAFLGGSITHMDGWRGLVMKELMRTYPGTDFTFLDAGIPSLGSLPHAFRLQRDVLDKIQPDLLFIEAAVNDAVNGTPEIQQERSLEGIVRHALKSNPKMDLVLMAFADETKMEAYSDGRVPVAVQTHQKIAAYYHLPFINLAGEVYTRIQRKEFSWEGDFKSLHPAPVGQQVYFRAIMRVIGKAVHRSDYNILNSDLPAARLPVPMDLYRYEFGSYRNIQAASDLKGFLRIADWNPCDSGADNPHAHVRPGFVHVPVLEGKCTGDAFTFNFKGTAVGLAILSGPDAGAIAYQIDGGNWLYLDLYTKWSSNLHLPWYILLGDQLSNSIHSLVVRITKRRPTEPFRNENTSSIRISHKADFSASGDNLTGGTAVRIVHFLVNEPH